jgi:hypothetical protein
MKRHHILPEANFFLYHLQRFLKHCDRLYPSPNSTQNSSLG